jgi:hypothetical protein
VTFSLAVLESQVSYGKQENGLQDRGLKNKWKDPERGSKVVITFNTVNSIDSIIPIKMTNN